MHFDPPVQVDLKDTVTSTISNCIVDQSIMSINCCILRLRPADYL